MEDILSGVEIKINKQMNEELIRPYVAEEMEEAFKQMHPFKAPGPNGMSPVFYQKY